MEEQGGPNGGESSTAQNEAQEHAGGGECPVWASRAHKKGGTWSPSLRTTTKVREERKGNQDHCETAEGRQRRLEGSTSMPLWKQASCQCSTYQRPEIKGKGTPLQ